MKIIPLVLEYLDHSRKLSETELTLVDNVLCDECYKILSENTLGLPSKCLIILRDYEIKIIEDSLRLVITKASIKSMNVSDYSKYLCLADHAPQVVDSLKQFKRSQVLSKLNSTDSSLNYVPEISENKSEALKIGFGGRNINSEFIKKRQVPKVIQSQDDILAALVPETCSVNTQFAKPESFQTEPINQENEIYVFPEWALIYLTYFLKN